MTRSLFEAIHEVEERIVRAPHILLCLDFDGTLAHFAANPTATALSPQMERVLRALAEYARVSVAIISGRDRADLLGRIDIPGLIYAGNHGLEISGPGYVFVEPTAAALVSDLQEVAGRLGDRMKCIGGALVEYKGLTISVHYRQVEAAAWEDVRRHVHEVLAGSAHPFVLTQGKMIFEIRPRVYWHKGSAVGWIRDKLGQRDALPIYVGDDVSDEDAFAALTDGITIKVGDETATAAQYRLAGPGAVRKFLAWLHDLLRHETESRLRLGGNCPC